MSGNRELLESLIRFPKRDVFDCVPLHYLVLKMSGMGCATPRRPIRKGTTVTTPLDIALFVVNLVLAVCMMAYGTLSTERPLQSSVMFVGLKLVNFTCYVSTIYGLISCFINRHEIWKIYNETHTIDTMLGALGDRTNFNRSFVLFVAYYGMATGTCLLMIGIMYYGNLSWLLLINLSYSYFSLTTFHIVSLTCLASVWVRNLRLNNVLRRQISQDDNVVDIPSITTSDRNQKLVLRQIMQIFDMICDLADKGSVYYGIQIMVSIGGSFVFLLFYTFAFTLVIRSVLPFDRVFRIGPIMSYAMFLYTILTVAFSGNALKQQALKHIRLNRRIVLLSIWVCFLQGKLTLKLIDRAINSTDSADIVEMLRMFLMQFGHRSPILTCGLFPFDWTLIFSILSTAATYIIILLQFESAGSSAA